ncbi:AraC family transcriptional regulator [Mucilaginibacter sp. AK015]|uniref:AraC family transcriptional regulator n=1 Tax=Mucilaginibacter sp. AK015 TaxID=2723072 RepID=UPI001620E7CF|nr:AraC family transcriptional regulator [Mucilaginibacter sp. AK015]MBB5395126.1 AraC-like DNA-binding protein [Mucilaginibacter sp. AK015]
MKKNFFKYLNITPVEERWGIYVTAAGYSKVEPFDNYPNQEHPESHHLTWNRGRILNDYYIVFISKGKGIYGSSLIEPTKISEGTCFFLHPGVLHRYKPDLNEGWEEYWVGFNGFFAKQLIESNFLNAQSPFVHLGLNKDLLILFRTMIECIQASLIGYPQHIAGTTMQILGLVHSTLLHDAATDDPVAKLISKAKFFMQEDLDGPLDMAAVAAQLPMGYSMFRKAFKRITGQSPNQYHLNLRLERAKNLLTTTILNVSEIADQTGFESVFYFSKLFKKKIGVSPLHYRNTIELKR